ncbi:MAG: serine--tRNA ligase [Patescibacteria group bacterium]
MLDIKFIQENKEKLKTVARQKNIEVDIDKLLKLDEERRKIMLEVEELRAKKNLVSKRVPQMLPTEKEAALIEMKAVGNLQAELEGKLEKIMVDYQKLMYKVPNIVSEKTPVGADESANVEVEKWGDLPKFRFTPKDHIQIGKELDIIDLERAAKIGGSRSYLLKGDGARLEAALIKYAEDFIVRKGFTLMNVPVIVNEFALYGTGFFPGAEEEIYHLEKDNKYLVGTSEVAIGAYHSDEILNEEDLPIKYAGFSVCFRREAGAYGKDTHGLYRVHQFLKVEQFIICKNDVNESMAQHAELLENSKELLRSLKIPHRVLNICTGDMGQGKYYMNDIESWMPSRNAYGETHSCSALLDYQARRLNLRYRDKTGKTQFCQTLNNTVIATPRVLIPLIELNQMDDGSIAIPEVLQPYMDNQTIIAYEKE